MRMILSIALGAVIVVGAQRATREPEGGWVVAVGGESFVVLDAKGAPAEVCTMDVGETYCHPIRHRHDLRRQPVERWRAGPGEPASVEAEGLAV